MYQILALGDCNTSGSEDLPPGECVPSKLADRLTARGRDVAVDNQGGTMNCSREGVARVARSVTRPDLALINYGLVDCWVTSVPWLHVPYYPDSSLRKQARKLLKSVKRRLRSPAARRIVGVGPVVRQEEFRANIGTIIERIRRRAPDCRIVLWGTVPVLDDDVRNKDIATYDSILRNLASETGCLWFDTRTAVEGLDGSSPYLDRVHLDGDGATRIADRMLALIDTPASLAAA